MWILPKQLHTSAYVPDTAALSLDLEESSQLCGQSLFVRSKLSPSRIWSRKWKRDSWTQHLFGRILRPSHGASFVGAWTSSLAVIRANHSAPQENAPARMTPAICGPGSQMELLPCDPTSVSSRTSKGTSALDSVTSSQIWNDLVTRRRGEYLARVKSALRTSGSESLSWPSPIASEVRQGFQDRSRGMKGSQESLTTVVVKDAALWPKIRVTQAEDCPSERNRRTPNLDSMVKQHGQAASASNSTGGNLPASSEVNWRTPSVAEEKTQSHSQQVYLQNQVGATPKVWATPRANKTEGYQVTSWQTPTVSTGAHRQKDGSMIDKLDQKIKQWSSPKASDPQHSGPNMRDSSVNYALPAQAVRETWATPQSRNWKEGANPLPHGLQQIQLPQQCGTGKLNPRWVETLMGLPIGWTMPSCTSPVTIVPMSCASSETASCPLPPPERS